VARKQVVRGSRWLVEVGSLGIVRRRWSFDIWLKEFAGLGSSFAVILRIKL